MICGCFSSPINGLKPSHSCYRDELPFEKYAFENWRGFVSHKALERFQEGEIPEIPDKKKPDNIFSVML